MGTVYIRRPAGADIKDNVCATHAFSKKWENHYAALALYFAYYNFVRIHSSIRVTPAMEAGPADHIWTLKELLSKIGR